MGDQTNMQEKWKEYVQSIATCTQFLMLVVPPDDWDALTEIKEIDDSIWSLLDGVEETA